MLFESKPNRAFTLIEILSTVAIIAALVLTMVVVIPNLLTWTRQTADKQTLTVLNDALTRYKCEGGNKTALTSGAPIAHVITALQAPISWAGYSHQVMQSGKTYIGRSISALGDGAQYRFTAYNTYTAEAGGTSPMPVVPPVVTDGDFEGAFDASGIGSFPGWTTGMDGALTCSLVVGTPHSGVQSAHLISYSFMGSTSKTSIEQSVTIPTNGTLTFWENFPYVSNFDLTVYFNSTVLLTQTTATANTWTQSTINLSAYAGQTGILKFRLKYRFVGVPGADVLLDDIIIQ